jgi:hypothetical protein
MRWLAVFFALCVAFFLGLHFGATPVVKKSPLCLEFADLTEDQMQEYLQLKDQQAKYEKANEIMAKIMQIFVADLGLHLTGEASCRIDSAEFPLSKPIMAAPAEPPPKVKAPEPPPSPAPAKRDHRSDKAIQALYQAVLWRAPDIKGEEQAAERFHDEHWEAYRQLGTGMMRGQEFLKQVEPNHTPQQIINHMYAVFMGRCAFNEEMRAHLDTLTSGGPGQVFSTILNSARQYHREQILAGGFSPSTCTAN